MLPLYLHLFVEDVCLNYVICACLRIVVFSTLSYVFVFFFFVMFGFVGYDLRMFVSVISLLLLVKFDVNAQTVHDLRNKQVYCVYIQLTCREI
jgi:hypothetical protein